MQSRRQRIFRLYYNTSGLLSQLAQVSSDPAQPYLAVGELSAPHLVHRFDSELPHSGQNFLPDVLSVPHLEQRMSVAQLAEQRLGVLQVGGVEALGEPVVNVGEHHARFVAASSVAQQSREASSCAQLP